MTIPLDEPTANVGPNTDKRQILPEPPPVRLLVIDDIWLEATSNVEKSLDAFYVGLLHFVREDGALCYKAERFRVCFRIVDQFSERDDYRPLMMQIPHWHDFRNALEEQGTPYEYQQGLTPGAEVLLLRDPAGNFVSVGMFVPVR
ncbi:MAG TPA: hypothetical protein VGB55_08460 [Tepidisphaeraceae bacterium]